jgi:PAS domain S-box-containing protein
LLVMARPIYTAAQQVRYIIATFLDVSARRTTDHAVQQTGSRPEQPALPQTTELLAANQRLHRELSERTLEQAALRQREHTYRMLVEHGLDAMLVADQNGTILAANAQLGALLGYSPQEMIGRSVGSLLPADAAEPDAATLTAVLAGKQVEHERTVLRKDGLSFVAERRATLLPDGRIQTVLRDMTAYQQREQALRAQSAWLRQVINQVPAIIWALDTDLRVTFSEGAGLLALGLRIGELVGQPLTVALESLGAASDPAWYLELHQRALNGEHINVSVPITGRVLQCYIGPLRSPDEPARILGAIGIAFDITDIVPTGEDQAAAALPADPGAHSLDGMQSMRDAFLALVSHELRTPLTAILGLSEALQEETYGKLNSRQRNALHLIESSGQHLLAIVNDILDFTELEAGTTSLNTVPVLVEDIGRASLRAAEVEARSKQLNIYFHSERPGLRVLADPQRLRQMLDKLLHNAVRFTPAGGKVGLEVRTDQQQELALLTIWDTGQGLTEAQQQRLFQPFVQADNGLSRLHEGAGLGLALVARLATLHGGRVSVASTPGQGSRFTIALPWQPQPVPAPQSGLVSRDASLTRPHRRVLLIEDNTITIELLQGYLEGWNYRVNVARTWLEALEAAITAAPDLILMDVQLPNLDGLAVIGKLRAMAALRRVPIVALTALVRPGDRERALQAGADDYLTKPVNLRMLVQVIERLLSADHTQ